MQLLIMLYLTKCFNNYAILHKFIQKHFTLKASYKGFVQKLFQIIRLQNVNMWKPISSSQNTIHIFKTYSSMLCNFSVLCKKFKMYILQEESR